MEYNRGERREQQQLLPNSIDDYVSEENPVRFLDAFVEGLDIEELGFRHAKLKSTGRPPYHPKDLLKLYIYGYMNRVRSSRRLEQETQRNLEVMWLLRGLRPDHKTISDFRKENKGVFKKVFRQFNLLCRKLDLFGRELVAIDGSKFKAMNSRDRTFSKNKLRILKEKIDKRIEAYLQELDAVDREERGCGSGADLQAKIRQLQQKREHYQEMSQRIEEPGGPSQISLSDPDSRAMKGTDPKDISHNVQIAVDTKHGLIVEHDVTSQVNDQQQLSSMAKKAQEQLGLQGKKEKLKVVADRGYYNAEEIAACEESNIDAYVYRPNRQEKKFFQKDQFQYDVAKDQYTCPAGQTLRYRYDSLHRGRRVKHYLTEACSGCDLKPQCTTCKRGRSIIRVYGEDAADRMRERVAAAPEIMAQRKATVERPFGTIKFWSNQRYFLVRGAEKVKAEFSLMSLAYNIRRALNIMGPDQLLKALQNAVPSPALASVTSIMAQQSLLLRPSGMLISSFSAIKGNVTQIA